MKVTKIEFVDHGIENSSYFQGCGVAFTPFDACFTGVGVSAISALDDALEQAAMAGYTIERAMEQEALDAVTFDDAAVPEDQDETYYHVSVRVKAAV